MTKKGYVNNNQGTKKKMMIEKLASFADEGRNEWGYDTSRKSPGRGN